MQSEQRAQYYHWLGPVLPVVFIQLSAGGVYEVLSVFTQQKSSQSGEVTVALEDDKDQVRSLVCNLERGGRGTRVTEICNVEFYG